VSSNTDNWSAVALVLLRTGGAEDEDVSSSLLSAETVFMSLDNC
jgi:hypothetical protein